MDSLPIFSKLDIDTFADRLDNLLDGHLKKIDKILAEISTPTWDNLMYHLDEMSDELEKLWSPVSHIHAVMNSDVLRKCYKECIPKLSAYSSAIGHNKKLYTAISNIDLDRLNPAQRKIVADSIRDFKLSGVALSSKNKQRFEEISTKLSELSNKYDNNLLDAVLDFNFHVTDERKMRGLPEYVVDSAKELAKEKDLPGFVLNLQQPTFVGVVTYAEDRDLRETFYEAYCTRASDKGPSALKFDNTEIMNETLELRSELAKLIGFENYAELSLATKMADSTSQVNDFLADLLAVAHPKAQIEFQELQKFGRDNYQLDEIKPWDIAFLSEKKQQQMFNISQEMLRPYFPVKQVMNGLFSIVNTLYGMSFEKISNADTWHKDVECYRIIDEEKHIRGYIYIDLFSRAHKRGGAWMDSCQSRYKKLDGSIQLPIATLTCNFAKAAANKPAILSHDEVETLFHEFGHCLHHILTKVDYISGSGVHGVEWDAVELPSQFFENWCWDEESIKLLTKHVETGKLLPSSIFKQLKASKNFQSAMGLVRQLEFSIFDFQIHENYSRDDKNFIANTLNNIRKQVSVVPVADYNRFQNGFSHIFAGGYAAGYYSYKWAEVLSCDAFSRFEEEGVFNSKTGRDFLHNILEVGGSIKAAEAFAKFRGREAKVDALLRHSGINNE
ncbi:MAG: M3 family metallopeptidase [Legionellaceae bacterium]|nr:M3 family metallopeptidase [Legionellaceae bacterium]